MHVALNKYSMNSMMTMPIFYLELQANMRLGKLAGGQNTCCLKEKPLQLQSVEDSMIVCRLKFLQLVS